MAENTHTRTHAHTHTHTHTRSHTHTHTHTHTQPPPPTQVREQAGDSDEARNDVTLSVIDKRTKVLTWRPSIRLWAIKCNAAGVVQADATRPETNGHFPLTVSASTMSGWMGPPNEQDHEDTNDVMSQLMDTPFTLQVSCECYKGNAFLRIHKITDLQ